MKVIDSPQNSWVKDLVRLKTKKERDKSNMILVEGEHLVKEAQMAGLLDTFISTQPPCDVLISEAVSEKLSNTKSGSQVFGLVRKPAFTLTRFQRIFILDGVQDPGNVGTIIRSAYSFGFDGVILTPDCADPYNDKTIRASQGAVFHCPHQIMTAEAILEYISHHDITLAITDVTQALSPTELLSYDKVAVVIGSEGSGVSDVMKQAAKIVVKIETSRFESLNAAVAAGILAYILKQ